LGLPTQTKKMSRWWDETINHQCGAYTTCQRSIFENIIGGGCFLELF